MTTPPADQVGTRVLYENARARVWDLALAPRETMSRQGYPPPRARGRHCRLRRIQSTSPRSGQGSGITVAGVAPVGAGVVNGFRYVPTSTST